MRFEGRVLFVTGGASGIGAATARRFSAEGGRVAIADLDLGKARALAAELPGAIGLDCDVADEVSVSCAVSDATVMLGRIDAVVNAAGYAAFGPLEQVSLEQWTRMLAVHLTGTFLVCKATLPALRAAGGGAIVNIASVAALIARSELAAYSAAKGAIVAFSRQFARDAVADNVRVNVIAPGYVRTALTEPLYRERGGGDYARGAASTASDSIQKRVAEPEEIAAPICFLLSDEASFITATTLVADGGQTAV